MWHADEIIVISDLHLAAERGRGLFQADDELAGFLQWVGQEARQSMLILNGDVLDFLVLGEGESVSDASDLTKATERAAQIVKKHKEVFLALSVLAKSPDHKVVILGGNHDPELALPEVRDAVETELERMGGPPGRVALDWVVHGLAAQFKVGAARIVVEHGDVYDAWNTIEHESLRRELMLMSRGLDTKHRRLPLRLLGQEVRYKQPAGSELVGLLTDIRRKFLWVDLLKPEAAVLPLIYANVNLNPLKDQRQTRRLLNLIKQYGRMSSRSLLSEVRRLLSPTTLYRGGNDETQRRRFERWLQSVERKQTRGLVREWSVESQVKLLVPYLRRISIEDGFYDISAPDTAARDVAFLIKQGADAVLHGHTHAAKAYLVPDTNGLYLNSGTWGRLMKLPPGDASEEVWSEFITDLNAGKEQSQSHLTFLRIWCERQTGCTKATLCVWRDGAAAILSAWSFAPASRAWRRDD